MSEDLADDQLAQMFPPGRQPQRPALLSAKTRELIEFDSLDALAARLFRALQGRTPVLIAAQGTFIGYDTFPVIMVHCVAGPDDRPTYLCAAAVQGASLVALEYAIVRASRARAAA